MKPSSAELLAALLAMFEGEHLLAYRDSGNVLTIGFGHTKDVQQAQEITHEQAVAYLIEDSSPLLALVAGFPTIKAAALASFGYNVGKGALVNVLQGKDSIDNPRHTTDRTGFERPGLVARRRLEKMLIDLA